MIHPLLPYTIKGALWYQGESNNGEGMLYFSKMRALISGWRSVWHNADMPFLFVQLAPYKYGGDPKRVVLCGFSRGAIACNYIGLHDDAIAKLWRAFIPYAHYDGVNERWGYPGADRAAAKKRLHLLGTRPQFICQETSTGRTSLAATRAYLKTTGFSGSFTFQSTGFRNHNDAWLLRPGPARAALRQWLNTALSD